MIKNVEELSVIPERKSLIDFDVLEYSEIETGLERAAEDVASDVAETDLEIVAYLCTTRRRAGRHWTVWIRSRVRRDNQLCYPECVFVQYRVIYIDSGCSLQNCVFDSLSGCQRDKRIRDFIKLAVEDASDRAGEIRDAVRLSTLRYRDSTNTPAVENAIRDSIEPGGFGNLVQIADREDMRTVKGRIPIGRSRLTWIVPVEEKPF